MRWIARLKSCGPTGAARAMPIHRRLPRSSVGMAHLLCARCLQQVKLGTFVWHTPPGPSPWADGGYDAVEPAIIGSRDQRVQTPNTSLRGSSITGHSSPSQPAYVPADLDRPAYSVRTKNGLRYL
jgi:hypothetical protein